MPLPPFLIPPRFFEQDPTTKLPVLEEGRLQVPKCTGRDRLFEPPSKNKTAGISWELRDFHAVY